MPEGRMTLIMKLIALLTLATMTATAPASAQTATPRRDPTDAEKVADADFHVGPHIMVVSPNQDELQAFTRDGASGMPYINHLPKRTEVFVVIPIREWDEEAR